MTLGYFGWSKDELMHLFLTNWLPYTIIWLWGFKKVPPFPNNLLLIGGYLFMMFT